MCHQYHKGLKHYADRPDVLVLALPRGGVPVGFEVSTALHVPLDVFLVRKLGVPGHEELAMGAIASGGVRVLNDDVIGSLNLPQNAIDWAAAIEQRELERRERLYRGDRPSPDLKDRIVILIDDGLATGSTMRAAAQAVRQHIRRASWSPYQPQRSRRAKSSDLKSTRSSAPSHRLRSMRSASGMRNSRRRATRKCVICSPARLQ